MELGTVIDSWVKPSPSCTLSTYHIKTITKPNLNIKITLVVTVEKKKKPCIVSLLTHKHNQLFTLLLFLLNEKERKRTRGFM